MEQTDGFDTTTPPVNPIAEFEDFLRNFQVVVYPPVTDLPTEGPLDDPSSPQQEPAPVEEGRNSDAGDAAEPPNYHLVNKYTERIDGLYSRGEMVLQVDLADLLQFSPILFHYLRNSPGHAILDFMEAYRNCYRVTAGALYNPDLHYPIEIIDRTHLCEVPISKIRAKLVTRLITIRGTVQSMGNIEHVVTVACFECPMCGNIMQIPQGGIYDRVQSPHDCSNPNCQNKKEFGYRSEDSHRIDYQRLRIQEEFSNQELGKMPESIYAACLYQLVGRVRPGDRVLVTGVYCEKFRDEHQSKKLTCIMDKYILVNSILVEADIKKDFEITPADEAEIRRLATVPGVHTIIRDSLAPAIYGMESSKMAVAVSLFGGVKITDQRKKTRGDIHTLLCGDPSTGKSEILVESSKLSYRSVYTTGKGATAAGLTAGLVTEKDQSMTLEAGAMVLASGGTACIDEIDKMRDSDRGSIHHAMEQQEIPFAKAGHVATLKSETTVIAAANPKNGRYDEFKSPVENINLEPALLSRFDQIILSKDRPNHAQDEAIANAILDRYDSDDATAVGETLSPAGSPAAVGVLIPQDLLKKYIFYARTTVFPKMTTPAKETLKAFYMRIRDLGENHGMIVPLASRQMVGLARISQAFARMRLSPRVEKTDADLAVDQVSTMIKGFGLDPVEGIPDIDRITGSVSADKRRKQERVLKEIQALWEEDATPFTAEEISDLLADEKISPPLMLDILNYWIHEKRLYKPTDQTYALVGKGKKARKLDQLVAKAPPDPNPNEKELK